MTQTMKKEDWMNNKWRPMMGWMYMFVCFFDFVLAPVAWSLLQALTHGNVSSQWQPLTLQGAGLFHLAMGAVLGIAAYGRTQEKLGGATTPGYMPQPGLTPQATFAPQAAPVPRPTFTPAPRPAVAADGLPDPIPNPRHRDD